MPKALVLTADEFEDIELLYPVYRLSEHNIEVVIAGPEKRILTGKHGYTVEAVKAFHEVKPEEYDMLILPGGKAPERVRLYEYALSAVRHFFETNKPVAAICHGPQVLISAGVLKNRTATSTRSIKDDVINAGAEWRDWEVVVDGNLVTARYPADIPAWMREFIKLLRMRGIIKE